MAIDTSTIDHVALARRHALAEGPIELYRRMAEIRAIELQIRDFHETGKAWGSTHCADGQEAVAVGVAAAVRPTDLMWVAHRVHGLGLALGCTPESILAENLGRVDGAVGGIGGSFHLTNTTVGLVHSFTIIGTQIAQAVGGAYAAQVRGTDQVALAMFGDGAINIGVFHEGLNLAAVWQAPVVFVLENNHYAEFTHVDRMTPISPLASRADSYGMPWEVVDGQDVEAVRDATAAAVELARSGGGPTLVELVTYRYTGHSRSDPAAYRPEGELDDWKLRDPLALYRTRLVEDGTASASELDQIERDIHESIVEAAAAALDSPHPTFDAIFDNVWAP